MFRPGFSSGMPGDFKVMHVHHVSPYPYGFRGARAGTVLSDAVYAANAGRIVPLCPSKVMVALNDACPGARFVFHCWGQRSHRGQCR